VNAKSDLTTVKLLRRSTYRWSAGTSTRENELKRERSSVPLSRMTVGGIEAALQPIWDTAGIAGVAGVRFANGDLWMSSSREKQRQPSVIYSVTKSFIAVACLRAVEKGCALSG
jgi:CubicO group peptidase (beta-lactamase class C family)